MDLVDRIFAAATFCTVTFLVLVCVVLVTVGREDTEPLTMCEEAVVAWVQGDVKPRYAGYVCNMTDSTKIFVAERLQD